MQIRPFVNQIIFLVICIGVCLRVYYFFFNPSLWGDEASLANNIIKYNLTYLCTQTLDNNQAAPPGYLLIVKSISSLFGYSELVLRLFSLICGIVALYIFSLTAKKLLSFTGSLLAILLFSLSPFLIYHSGELKQYQTEVLVTTIILYFTFRFRYTITYIQAAQWGGILGLCIYFSNTSIFILAGVFLAFFWRSIRKRDFIFLKKIILCGSLWSILFIIYYAFIISRNSNVQLMVTTWASEFFPFPTHVRSLHWYVNKTIFLFNNPLGLSLDINFFPSIFIRWRYLLYFSYPALVILVLGSWTIWKQSKYLFALLFLPIGFTIAASLLQKYPFHERFLLFLVPIVYLIIGHITRLPLILSPTHKLRKYHIVPLFTSLTLIYVGFNIAYKTIRPEFFGGDLKFSNYRDAILFIDKHRNFDEPVYLAWNSVRFYNYYHVTKNLRWPIITGSILENGAHSKEEIEAKIKNILTQNLKNHKKAWFLLQSRAYPYPITDLQGNKIQINEPLEKLYFKTLQNNGRIIKTYSGNPVKVYLVDLTK